MRLAVPANSAAAIRYPSSHFDMVRCGIAIYGLSPFQGDAGADGLRPALPPWNVNIIAQKVGAAVLEQEAYLVESLAKVREAKKLLVEELTGLGFRVLPSDAHYFLVRVGDAAACRRSLLRYGILVRDGTSFGLPEYVRIAPRTLPECRKLVAAMGKILRSGGPG